MLLALKPEQLATIAEIAAKFGASKNHLVKVVHRLASMGYIESTQGRGGGIRLQRRPEDIVVGKIVREMEATLNIIDCEGAQCPLEPACRLKGVLNDATSAFLAVLDAQTIADLVKNRRQLLRLVR